MKKNVNISLISKQSDGENTEQIELLTEGLLRYCKDGYELSYEETDATGFEGAVTKLSVTEHSKVVMSRTGASGTDLVIELGKKHHCHYGTPYGEFMVGVTAKTIRSDMTENGGRLDFSYVIDVNSGYVGDFEINIGVKPVS
ncbi:MAG: DUF1934 domain-containing protein [Ruminococcus sp.]|nr:DUF1934 domain-containing protein [Ruminococcus sp.]